MSISDGQGRFLDREFLVDGAENIEISFYLAGLGSRALAIILDLIIQSLVVSFLMIPVLFLGAFFQSAEMALYIIVPVMIIIFFIIFWGYHIVFELYWKGQTPGKRILNIRVVRDDGRPVDFLPSFLRNVLRIVDMLPSAYGVGLISAFVGKQEKRLGDMAAGTVVIKAPGAEKKLPITLPIIPDEVRASFDELMLENKIHQFDLAEVELLKDYLRRRFQLNKVSKYRLQVNMAKYFCRKLNLTLNVQQYETFLIYLGRSILTAESQMPTG